MLKELLTLLTDGRRGYSVAQLAAQLHANPETVYLAIRQLEAMGLIRRPPCQAVDHKRDACRGCPVVDACQPPRAQIQQPRGVHIGAGRGTPGNSRGAA